MGQASRSKVVAGYRKKLFDGRTTVQDVWRQHVVHRNLCRKCQSRAIIEGHPRALFLDGPSRTAEEPARGLCSWDGLGTDGRTVS